MQNQDKGLVDYKGKPLVEHVINRLSPQVKNVLISCNRNLEQYRRYRLPIVEDEIKDYSGPLRGILSACQYISDPYTLVAPCDMPDLPHDLVEMLLTEMDKAEISCCYDGTRQQSLVFIVKTELIPTISLSLEQGKRSVKSWFTDKKVIDVNFDDQKDAFLNINDRKTLI